MTGRVTDYQLSRRTRLCDNLLTAGQTPDKRILRLGTLPADPREAEARRPPPGAPLHVWEGISTADCVPISLFRSVFDAARLPSLAGSLRRHLSVAAALADCGVPDCTRDQTRLSAEAATPMRAPSACAGRRAAVARGCDQCLSAGHSTGIWPHLVCRRTCAIGGRPAPGRARQASPRCLQGKSKPRRMAATTSAAGLFTSSLRISDARWLSTVLGLIDSSSPMRAFVRPRAIRSST